MLNLDVPDIVNREELIEEWASSAKIAAGTLDLNKTDFIRLLEMSLSGSVKGAWEMTPAETKTMAFNTESLNEIIDNVSTLFKIQFVGVDYFNGQDT